MIIKASAQQLSCVVDLAMKLWPDNVPEELGQELSETLKKEDAAIFLDFHGDTPVGFAQCQLRRDYVEGTETSPVGYLEGVYVEEGYRRCGIAKALVEACQDWAKAMGCVEFASDCELDNIQSLQFHLGIGFLEANRIICFTKKL